MIAGSTPAVAQETIRASGVRPRAVASSALIRTSAAAPSLMPEALPAVTVPSFENAGFSLASPSSVVPARIYSSASTAMSPLRVANRDGHDLVGEFAGLLRGLGLVLRAEREFVLLLAADLPFGGDVLGRDAHVIAVEGIDQAVAQHGVDEFDVAHFRAGAQMRGMRRLRHAFLAAGDDDLGVAIGDLLHAERHRAQARAADLIEAPGRLFLRNAGLHRRLTGGILALARGQDLSKDDLVDFVWRDLGALAAPR